MTNADSLAIRPATPADREAVYAICLRTGDDGGDATELYSDPELAGHVWAGAYLVFEPALAFVLTDSAGVAGYVLGAADTLAFEARCEREWWPALRLRYPPGSGRTPRDRFAIDWIHEPPHTAPGVAERYPAHLHIDLLPRAQGRGQGRRLLEVLDAALAERGVDGVHLVVSAANPNAIEFYRRVGFDTLGEKPGALVMARPLTASGS